MAEMVFERASEAFPHVRDFVAAAQMAESLKSLQDMISRVLPRFGLDYFLMSHHVDFGKPAPGTVQISNYPAEFVAVQREHGGWRDDPVLLACEKTTAGFFWSDVVTLMPLSDYHRSRFEMGRRYGLADSFVVPNHIPGEYSGSVHFTVGPSRPFPRHLAPALQSFATYGFEAARRLARTHDGSTLNSVPLTDRLRPPVCARQERHRHRPAARPHPAHRQRIYRGGQAPLLRRHAAATDRAGLVQLADHLLAGIAVTFASSRPRGRQLGQ